MKDMKPIAYEFECECLADFKYSIDSESGETNRQTEKRLVSRIIKEPIKGE